MTQFASTLYPQTNPSNPVLLEFRSCLRRRVPFTNARNWAYNLMHPLHDAWSYATPEQIEHARKVLIRLASFSG